MQYPETRYARSREGHVAYQVVGDGPLDLVFIPSWTSNVDVMWEQESLARFLRRLATFSRLICFDKRGSGVSDTVPLAALPTLEQWSDDVLTVMQAADSKRAALLGHSVGGQMAMLFAASHPERTSALILVDSCACAITDAVRTLGLEIRAGLHTGEIELAGSDVRGIAVHIGSRVAGQAGAGEVLVSSTVKDLVAGSGIRFADRGLHTLKGVPGEWRLFSAEHPRAA